MTHVHKLVLGDGGDVEAVLGGSALGAAAGRGDVARRDGERQGALGAVATAEPIGRQDSPRSKTRQGNQRARSSSGSVELGNRRNELTSNAGKQANASMQVYKQAHKQSRQARRGSKDNIQIDGSRSLARPALVARWTRQQIYLSPQRRPRQAAAGPVDLRAVGERRRG
jgi:hypothetical protein